MPDEQQVTFRISSVGDVVMVTFEQPIAWMRFTPAQALEFAGALTVCAGIPDANPAKLNS